MRALIAALVMLAPLISLRPAGAHPVAGGRAPLAGAGALPAGAGSLGGLLAVTLLVALMLAAAREGGPRPRVPALATSGLVLAFVAGSAPHLVHHVLGSDQASHCQILLWADHADAIAAAPEPPPASRVAWRLSEAARRHPAAIAPRAACGRAPPAA